VRVLDLSDPTHPAQLGYYNTRDPQTDYATGAFYEGAVGLGVDLNRKLVFVADSRATFSSCATKHLRRPLIVNCTCAVRSGCR
jgi:hypothetical protein